jgi:hypothetical protein
MTVVDRNHHPVNDFNAVRESDALGRPAGPLEAPADVSDAHPVLIGWKPQ